MAATKAEHRNAKGSPQIMAQARSNLASERAPTRKFSKPTPKRQGRARVKSRTVSTNFGISMVGIRNPSR